MILPGQAQEQEKTDGVLGITGLHVEAEPTVVLATQPKQRLTSVGGDLDTRGVWGRLPSKDVLAALFS